MNRLIRIGFQPVGNWTMQEGLLVPQIHAHHHESNLIYCFVVNTVPKYFGISINSLLNRMNQYARPAEGQRTNMRLNGEITQEINQGHVVEIYIFIDNGLFHYGDFRVNLALGLEYTLIGEYRPAWNIRGNPNRNQNIIFEALIDDLNGPENINIDDEPFNQLNFSINVIGTYFNLGFINIPANYSDNFGEEGDQVTVVFADAEHVGRIYRSANNGYPRIYVGRELSEWINQNFEIGQIIFVTITGINTIQLSHN